MEPLSPDLGRERREIAPGAVHLPSWLDEERQRDLAELFERYAQVPVPMRAPAVRGNLMSVRMVCLGWHWQPYRYSRVANDVNGEPVAAIPEWLCELGAEAVTDAYGNDAGSTYRPDVALINYYDDEARMGMHQDKDEGVNEPVVSLSVGDTGRFRFGNVENRAKPYRDLDLETRSRSTSRTAPSRTVTSISSRVTRSSSVASRATPFTASRRFFQVPRPAVDRCSVAGSMSRFVSRASADVRPRSTSINAKAVVDDDARCLLSLRRWCRCAAANDHVPSRRPRSRRDLGQQRVSLFVRVELFGAAHAAEPEITVLVDAMSGGHCWLNGHSAYRISR